MEIFGWVMLFVLAAIAVALIVLLAIPFVVTQIKTLKYKITKEVEVGKNNIDERAVAKKSRLSILRKKEIELKDKKLELKLLKLAKALQLANEKIRLQQAIQESQTEVQNELNNNTQNDEPTVDDFVDDTDNSSIED